MAHGYTPTTDNWQQTTNAILFIIILIEKTAMCIVRASRLLAFVERLTIFPSENTVCLFDWRFFLNIGAEHSIRHKEL